MKTSSESFDGAGAHEALLGEHRPSTTEPSFHGRNGVNRCNILLWLCSTGLVGVAVGLLIGYGLLRPGDTQCVKQTTQASE